MRIDATIAAGCLLFQVLWVSSSGALASDGMKGPDLRFEKTSRNPVYQTSTVKFVWKNAIKVYSRFISPADGPRSPSYPTGTQYGKQAIEQHGFFIGIVLIADRLLHEADIHQGSKITIYGTTRYYDPIENNTYWWDRTKK